MELDAIRNFIRDHPDGVLIRMVDGQEYPIPHRDWISFGPVQKTLSGKEVVRGTSFLIFEEPGGVSSMRLVNALLVKEVVQLKQNGNGHHAAGQKG